MHRLKCLVSISLAFFSKCRLAIFIVGLISVCAPTPSAAGGTGKFLGSLLARAAVREVGRSMPGAHATKLYGPDVLTTAQLANCLTKASKLDQESEQLSARRANVSKSTSEIEMAGVAVESQKQRVDRYNKKSVDAFNALVEQYNLLLTNGKAGQATFNLMVDSHNAAIEVHNRECAKKYYADDLLEAQKLAGSP